MSAAILIVDLEELPQHELAVESRYERALLLLRSRGRFVGRRWCRVSNGRLAIESPVLENLVESASWAFWQGELEDFLEWDGRPSAPPPRATVAVCTRDRTDDLARCLAAVRRQAVAGGELLVVDNCPSSESTRDLVARMPDVRYVREERPGLDIARNRALREARHDLVAFADDDTAPDENWLASLVRDFDDPEVACVTGLTLPIELETEAQVDFERFCPFARGYVRRTYSRREIDPLAAGVVGAGANMAIRRSLAEAVGFFDESLDAGTPAFSGGDTELFSRILEHGYRIVFEPTALSWHRHPRTREAVRRCVYGYGVGTYAFWTRRLLVEKEWRVFVRAAGWLVADQLPRFVKSLVPHAERPPLDLCWAELRGCARGPLAYLSSRAQAARRGPFG